MNRQQREFMQSTLEKLDELLASLNQEERHDLLDRLAGEIEERLDQVIDEETEGSGAET